MYLGKRDYIDHISGVEPIGRSHISPSEVIIITICFCNRRSGCNRWRLQRQKNIWAGNLQFSLRQRRGRSDGLAFPKGPLSRFRTNLS